MDPDINDVAIRENKTLISISLFSSRKSKKTVEAQPLGLAVAMFL